MATVNGGAEVERKIRDLSQKFGKTDVKVIVGFTQYYAIYVHENLESRHPVGQAKFLEEPYRQMLPELKDMIARGMRKGLDALQALIMAGLRLQREAQLLCPVDTGALKNSAFTRQDTMS